MSLVEPAALLIYAPPMRRGYFLLVLALLSEGVSAQVYRWVDADGHTHYSDRPARDAEVLTIDRRPRPGAPDLAVPPPSGAPFLGPYASFEIVSPRPNETLRQEAVNLPVSLLLDPPLMSGHALEMVLDGAIVSGDHAVGTQFSVKGLPYGSHAMEAQIRNAGGDIVARTASMSFHLRKPLPPGVLQ